jgi:hypothetical protein
MELLLGESEGENDGRSLEPLLGISVSSLTDGLGNEMSLGYILGECVFKIDGAWVGMTEGAADNPVLGILLEWDKYERALGFELGMLLALPKRRWRNW